MKEYFREELTEAVETIIKNRSKEAATNVISGDFQRILNTIMFLLKHSGHSIYFYRDTGVVLKNVDKWFEGKMEVISAGEEDFAKILEVSKEDDLVWDKKFKGYKI